jgi:N6-adenosine-specific RNA methylase IME4
MASATVPAKLPASIIALQSAAAELAKWTDIDEIKRLRDLAETARLYCLKVKAGNEAISVAVVIRNRAVRREGEVLRDLVEHKGGRPQKNPRDPQGLKNLDELGITFSESSRAQAVANIPEKEFEANERATLTQLYQLGQIFKIGRQADAQKPIIQSDDEDEATRRGIVGSLEELIESGDRYSTIYADPPWRYGNQGTRGATDDHYRTMTVDEICAEPVAKVVTENAHLHFWTTNAFLPQAFRVIEAWGFEYKSCFVWVKPQMGMGNYWRVAHEFLLFGVRGKAPFRSRDEISWGEFDRKAHSEKPNEIRQLIERVSPPPYLEMYGRLATGPWTVYGNQVQRSIW